MAGAFPDVVVAGVYNTEQARFLEGHTPDTLLREAILGALADSGLGLADVDGVSVRDRSRHLVHDFGVGPAWYGLHTGIGMVLEAAGAITSGACSTVVIAAAEAGTHRARTGTTAPWTRPANEFTAPFGLFTAAEFALVARELMHQYGYRQEHFAQAAATVRNNGHVNPAAGYHGRGPYTADDVLASPLVAEPLHRLDCAMTSEGGTALVLTRRDRVPDLRAVPVALLGGAVETFGPHYELPPLVGVTGRRGDRQGDVGAQAAQRAFRAAGIGVEDVDAFELYDAFSPELLRQLDVLGVCKPGEAAGLVEDGEIGPGGRFPITTDGGLMSFSHPGGNTQQLQRFVRAVEQVRGSCASRQVDGAEVALCTNGGGGALYFQIAVVGALR